MVSRGRKSIFAWRANYDRYFNRGLTKWKSGKWKKKWATWVVAILLSNEGGPVKRRQIIKEYSWSARVDATGRSILESRSKRRLRVDGPRRYKAVARQSTTSLVPCKKAISFLRGWNSSPSLLRAVCDISATRLARGPDRRDPTLYIIEGITRLWDPCRKREIAFGRRSGKLCQPFRGLKFRLVLPLLLLSRFLGL